MKFQFPKVTARIEANAQEWTNWIWQLSHSLTKAGDFETYFQLSEGERDLLRKEPRFPFRTTPYYASLADPQRCLDPIRLMQIPHVDELDSRASFCSDPLGEEVHQVAPRLIHRYSDRVLLLVTDTCGLYCRYCTRKHFVGKKEAFIRERDFKLALNYIQKTRGIREVILSGGDPLTLSDSALGNILSEIRSIPHIEIIRLGTRMLSVCPMRISESTSKMLRRYAPLFVMTHFNHPRELTFEAKQAIDLLVDSGIPLFNQMVLLNRINNHPATIQALSRRLLYLRIKPYYIFQCDPSEGTEHLKTSIDSSLSFQKELWGHLSGLAMPHFSMDIPEGGGKVPLFPKFETSATSQSRSYKGFDGVSGTYYNPPPSIEHPPIDAGDYQVEWEELRHSRGSRGT